LRLPVRCLEITSVERSLAETELMGLDPAAFRFLPQKQLHYNLKVEGLTGTQAETIKDCALAGPCVVTAAPGVSAAMVLSGTLEALMALTESLKLNQLTVDTARSVALAISNSRKDEFVVKGRTKDLMIGPATLVMGILNVTPDSFSDGGLYADKSRAIERALEMCDQGAGWIDVGGESTRPGSSAVALEEELKRVIPVVEALASRGVIVSIDTTKAAVAREALAAGASIVNDVSALSVDPLMAPVCAEYGVPVVLMHMRGTPRTMQLDTAYSDIVGDVYGYLWSRVEHAVKSGISRESIIIDPGLGFGKSVQGNFRLVKDLKEFKSLGLPILVGPSRKSFIGATIGADSSERLSGTLAASVIAIVNGANILRVHDVKEAVEAATVADAVVRS